MASMLGMSSSSLSYSGIVAGHLRGTSETVSQEYLIRVRTRIQTFTLHFRVADHGWLSSFIIRKYVIGISVPPTAAVCCGGLRNLTSEVLQQFQLLQMQSTEHLPVFFGLWSVLTFCCSEDFPIVQHAC